MDANTAKSAADAFNNAKHKEEMDAVLAVINEAAQQGKYYVDINSLVGDWTKNKLMSMGYGISYPIPNKTRISWYAPPMKIENVDWPQTPIWSTKDTKSWPIWPTYCW